MRTVFLLLSAGAAVLLWLCLFVHYSPLDVACFAVTSVACALAAATIR